MNLDYDQESDSLNEPIKKSLENILHELSLNDKKSLPENSNLTSNLELCIIINKTLSFKYILCIYLLCINKHET